MLSLCQDMDENIIFTQRTERLGVSGFEKLLFAVLVAFSLLWVFYLRHFAPLVIQKNHTTTFEIEFYRAKPAPVSEPLEIVQPEPERPLPVPVPGKAEPRVTPKVQEAQPRQKLEVLSETELKERVIELYKADHLDLILPDSDLQAYRPDDVFDPRLADKIARQRKRNDSLRRAQNGNDGDEVYFDNMGVRNYRRGNTCYQIIEIPGVDHQWYAGKCAITRDDMELKFKGKDN